MATFPHSYQSRVGSGGLYPQRSTPLSTQPRSQKTTSLQQFGDRETMLMASLANINTKQGPHRQKVGDFALARAVGGFDTNFKGSPTLNLLTRESAPKSGLNLSDGVNSDSFKAMMRGREFAAIAHDFDGNGGAVFLIKNVSDDLNNPDLRLFMMNDGAPQEWDTHGMPLEDLMGKGGRLVFGNTLAVNPQKQPNQFQGGPTLDVLNRFLGDPKMSHNELAETAINHLSQMPEQEKNQRGIDERSLFQKGGTAPTSEKVVSDPAVIQRTIQKRAQQQGKLAPQFERIPRGGFDQISQEIDQFAAKTAGAAKILVTGFNPQTRENQSVVFTRNQQNEWVRFDGKNEIKQSPKDYLLAGFGLGSGRGIQPTTPQLSETSLVSLGPKNPTQFQPSAPLDDLDNEGINESISFGPKKQPTHDDTTTKRQTPRSFQSMDEIETNGPISYPQLKPRKETTVTPKQQTLDDLELELETQDSSLDLTAGIQDNLNDVEDLLDQTTHDQLTRRISVQDLSDLDTPLSTPKLTPQHESMEFDSPILKPQLPRNETPVLSHQRTPSFSQSLIDTSIQSQLTNIESGGLGPKSKSVKSQSSLPRVDPNLSQTTVSPTVDKRIKSLVRRNSDLSHKVQTQIKTSRQQRRYGLGTPMYQRIGVSKNELRLTRQRLRHTISTMGRELTNLNRGARTLGTQITLLERKVQQNELLLAKNKLIFQKKQAVPTESHRQLEKSVQEAKQEILNLKAQQSEILETAKTLGGLKQNLTDLRMELAGAKPKDDRTVKDSYRLAKTGIENWPQQKKELLT